MPSLPSDDYPLIKPARAALEAAAHPTAGWKPLGYTAANYLDLVRDICAFFRPYQDARGAIVDPYAGEEKQYATPCYAVAAALVALDGRAPAGVWGPSQRGERDAPADQALLESAAMAQDHSLRSLAVDKNTAQNHADFFAPLVVLAYQLLAPFVTGQRAARWLAELRSIDPESTYRNTFAWKQQQGQAPTVHNWNVVAAAGELLRHRAGAGSHLSWVDRYLGYQLKENADLAWGLYRDPNCPLPYDLFPRHHLAYATAAAGTLPAQDEGRRTQARLSEERDTSFAVCDWSQLVDWLRRGEWTSALTQTASGGIPPGWRSSEHLWNDAALVALGEVAAARHAREGDLVAAGLFRRVAALAFRDMLHWRRPSGDLHVVKNHFDPADRFGFEAYSFHSNYGLYPAAMLATAILFGDCRTPERPAPVETGRFVVRYPDPFHRLVATHHGRTVAIDLNADGHYDVTGLNSLRQLHAHPLLGPASGIPAQPRYHVPASPGAAYAAGVRWTAPDGTQASLASLRPSRVDVAVDRRSSEETAFTVRYWLQQAGCESIVERYRLLDVGLEIEASLEAVPSVVESAMFAWPFPADDGRDRSSVRAAGGALEVRLAGNTQRVTVQGAAMAVARDRVAHRNGYAGVATARLEGQTAQVTVGYE